MLPHPGSREPLRWPQRASLSQQEAFPGEVAGD